MQRGVREWPERLPLLKAAVRRLRHFKAVALRRWEGERILRGTYRELAGRDLDIERPHGFSEKLFRRLVLMNRTLSTAFTPYVDKYTARDYVAKTVGEQYLTRLYWHGLDPARIPFDQLPDTYVIKTNHASGQTIVVTGPVDEAAVVRKSNTWLKHNHYWEFREYQYYDIKPRIMIEELLDDGWDDGPLDYRFWCFNGVPTIIQATNHSHSLQLFVDADWKPLDLHFDNEKSTTVVAAPENLAQMKQIASALAEKFDFVRVDLYNVHGRICFGELTFTPRAARFRFTPSSWDLTLGDAWAIST